METLRREEIPTRGSYDVISGEKEKQYSRKINPVYNFFILNNWSRGGKFA
jgi:hypothetical protein